MDSPNVADIAKPTMLYEGAAKDCSTGHPIGLVDIGESEIGYLFRVSLPGLQKNECDVTIKIEKDGVVEIRGKILEDRGMVEGSKSGYRIISQQLCLPGPFKLFFQLPGPVDPRLYKSIFQGDGILEVTVMKRGVPDIP